MLTRGSAFPAEVASLVTTQDTGRLGLRCSTTGEFRVEVHNAIHTGSILSSSNCLCFFNVS